MIGLLIVSIGSGQFISRTGRYRIFPIAGTALTTIGLLLLSQMGVATSSVLAAFYMLILGMGLGCVMQVLVLVVQNAVPYSELGVATSAATFFRSIGGSFGTAVFGAIFSNVLVGDLVRHLHGAELPSTVSASGITPAILNKLPAVVHHGTSPGSPKRSKRCSSSPRRSPSWHSPSSLIRSSTGRGVGASASGPADAHDAPAGDTSNPGTVRRVGPRGVDERLNQSRRPTRLPSRCIRRAHHDYPHTHR